MKSTLIFLSGLGLGTVLGLLIAPEPGRETLKKIKAEADKIVDKVIQKQQMKQEVKEMKEALEMASEVR
jgi:gas vesicle protein